MRVNSICAKVIKKFNFRKDVFLNVCDELRGRGEFSFRVDSKYYNFVETIKRLDVKLDEDSNWSVNGKTEKIPILGELVSALISISYTYGLYVETVLDEEGIAYYKVNKELISYHYIKLIGEIADMICIFTL